MLSRNELPHATEAVLPKMRHYFVSRTRWHESQPSYNVYKQPMLKHSGWQTMNCSGVPRYNCLPRYISRHLPTSHSVPYIGGQVHSVPHHPLQYPLYPDRFGLPKSKHRKYRQVPFHSLPKSDKPALHSYLFHLKAQYPNLRYMN